MTRPQHTSCPLTTTIPPALQRRAFAAFAAFLAFSLRPPPSAPLFPAPHSPPPCSLLPTPRPPPFRPLFPSDHVLPSLPSLFLFFLHLIRLLFSCHPFHVPVAPVSISSRNCRHHEGNLDTLGSLVLCYMHITSLSLPLTLSLSLSPLSVLSTLLPPPTRLPTHPTPTSRDGSDNADSHHAHNNRLLSPATSVTNNVRIITAHRQVSFVIRVQSSFETDLDRLQLISVTRYSLLLARAHKQLHGFFPRAPVYRFLCHFLARTVFAVFSAFFSLLAISIIINTLYPISTKLLSCCLVRRSFVDPSNRFLICTTCTRTSILEFAHVVRSLCSLSTQL
ncbi:hypothetical protein C8J57DRAFT_1722837 [Mycena rebaudengoi]|nr:hypothetical protein C8J57DRAFT_1722837 [Mycena rebaudengoi]